MFNWKNLKVRNHKSMLLVGDAVRLDILPLTVNQDHIKIFNDASYWYICKKPLDSDKDIRKAFWNFEAPE